MTQNFAGHRDLAAKAPFSRIVICGAVYARNLGDGIIAECLAAAINKAFPATPVALVDLSARSSYDSHAVRGKDAILKVLRRAPAALTRVALLAGIGSFLVRKAKPRWQDLFKEGDLVVIGGGHLLSDYHLNFPSKLALLTMLAKRAGSTIAICSVGVSRRWSRLGTRLFCNVTRAAAVVAVRDAQSQQNLKAHIPGLDRVSLVVDPGYLARIVYAEHSACGRGVGLNLSDPEELGSYGSKDAPLELYDAFWVSLARHYAENGRTVTIFTNGADEDERYLARIVDKLRGTPAFAGISIPGRPATPADLVGLVKGLDLLIGHRLHAHIVAFVHGVPTIGLGWDEKLEAQFAVMQRLDYLVPFDKPEAQRVLALAAAAETSPPDREIARSIEGRVGMELTAMVEEAASHRSSPSRLRPR